MLHLIADSILTQAVVERIGAGDDVLLQAGAVWSVHVGHQDNGKVVRLLAQQCRVYVLSDVLAAYGLEADRVLPGVKVIDYSAFVRLTVDNPVVHTWC